MNRYPLWKYLVIAFALVIGVLYALPNLFGESPAVQVSAARSSVKVDLTTVTRVEQALAAQSIQPSMLQLEGNSVRARFDSTDVQIKARDAIERTLNADPTNPGYVVALNLVPRTPAWLSSLGASPMYLGLDLRGGVHFMLQVDMPAALVRKADVLAGDLRSALREKNVRHGGIQRNGQAIELRARDAATAQAVQAVIQDQFPDLQVVQTPDGADFRLKSDARSLRHAIDRFGLLLVLGKRKRRAIEHHRRPAQHVARRPLRRPLPHPRSQWRRAENLNRRIE